MPSAATFNRPGTPLAAGTVSCLPGWRLIDGSYIPGRSLLVNYFSTWNPNLTQIRQELGGIRIAGAAVITRTWETLSSGMILFVLFHGHLHSSWFNAQLPLDLWKNGWVPTEFSFPRMRLCGSQAVVTCVPFGGGECCGLEGAEKLREDVQRYLSCLTCHFSVLLDDCVVLEM